jgi:acetyl esterase/lipase
MKAALILMIAVATTLATNAECVVLAADSKAEKISLWNNKAPIGDGKFAEEDATLHVYRAAKPNGTAVVICPGGGYGGLAIQPEGHGIAKWLNKHGITGVVLQYRLPKGRSTVPLSDAHRAIQTTRFNGKKWKVDDSKVGVIGFSAGGHLASTCATHFAAGNPKAKDPLDRISTRPDFAILIYPVITMGKATHGGSKRNLLGNKPSAELVKHFSNELQVTENSSPTFLAHALDDAPVPPINSQLFYKALVANKVQTKYVELPNGGHGLNGYKGPSWDRWQKESLIWLGNLKLGQRRK